MKIEFFSDAQPQPVLLIYEGTPSEVAALQWLFNSLGGLGLRVVPMHLLPGVTAVGGCHLDLAASDEDEGITKKGSENSFRCTLTKARWQDVAEMIEPLKKSGGHVFLDVKGHVSLIMSSRRAW